MTNGNSSLRTDVEQSILVTALSILKGSYTSSLFKVYSLLAQA